MERCLTIIKKKNHRGKRDILRVGGGGGGRGRLIPSASPLGGKRNNSRRTKAGGGGNIEKRLDHKKESVGSSTEKGTNSHPMITANDNRAYSINPRSETVQSIEKDEKKSGRGGLESQARKIRKGRSLKEFAQDRIHPPSPSLGAVVRRSNWKFSHEDPTNDPGTSL